MEDRATEIRKIFNEVDTDGSGVIEQAELYVALQKVGIKATRGKVNGILKRLDVNQDGSISFNEFELCVHDLDQNQRSFTAVVQSFDHTGPTHKHTHKHTHTHAHAHTQARTRTHTHTHTH